MLGRIILKRNGKHEGESPFWISFADLMSAMMILFLVVMAVTLIAVTKEITTEEAAKVQREKEISKVIALIQKDSAKWKDVKFNGRDQIDLGEIVRFDYDSYMIKPEAARFLREYIPVLLNAKQTPEGAKWMRRVVVEGFTDPQGTYLYNVGLSLNRSKAVLCSLYAPVQSGDSAFTTEQLLDIQRLFSLGGYSFNSVRTDHAASRRVELKIDFWSSEKEINLNESIPSAKGFGQC